MRVRRTFRSKPNQRPAQQREKNAKPHGGQQKRDVVLGHGWTALVIPHRTGAAVPLANFGSPRLAFVCQQLAHQPTTWLSEGRALLDFELVRNRFQSLMFTATPMVTAYATTRDEKIDQAAVRATDCARGPLPPSCGSGAQSRNQVGDAAVGGGIVVQSDRRFRAADQRCRSDRLPQSSRRCTQR